MKPLRIVCVLFFFMQACFAQDSLKEIPVGVIRVKKPVSRPFIEVEYKLYLSKVTTVAKQVPFNDGIPGDYQIDNDFPIYDSSLFTENVKRVYPQKTILLSRYFAENLQFRYTATDTSSSDTLRAVMWLSIAGDSAKIKRVDADTSSVGNMPDEMEKELAWISEGLSGTNWGKVGGMLTPKSGQFMPMDYCAEIFVIVSARPLTAEQKRSGMYFAPHDYPLNCPADTEAQASINPVTKHKPR